jgi:hypothetical protein
LLLHDYDTSAQLPVASCKASDQHIEHSCEPPGLIRSSIVWDSVYFERIARCGYEYEHFLAFFPGWPWLVKSVYVWFGARWSQGAALLLSSLSFSLSSVLLRRCVATCCCFADCKLSAPAHRHIHTR